MTGVVFDLKRFAVHDGAGIRSTLFCKGCPLRCAWCQNPEGLSFQTELWHSQSRCLRCKSCVAVCPAHALTLSDDIHVERSVCKLCGACVEACPAGAMELCGYELTPEEAAQRLLRDKVFFGSAGGVTLSGGEALAQSEFSLEVLARCKAVGADTAVESCLYVPRETLMEALPLVDHFLVDIKLFDPAAHKAATGVENGLILSNYEYLVSRGADLLVRTPLIPGYTANEENIRSIARYLHKISPGAKYELLNFNPLCRSKYGALNKSFPVSGSALSEAELAPFYRIAAEEKLQIIKES